MEGEGKKIIGMGLIPTLKYDNGEEVSLAELVHEVRIEGDLSSMAGIRRTIDELESGILDVRNRSGTALLQYALNDISTSAVSPSENEESVKQSRQKNTLKLNVDTMLGRNSVEVPKTTCEREDIKKGSVFTSTALQACIVQGVTSNSFRGCADFLNISLSRAGENTFCYNTLRTMCLGLGMDVQEFMQKWALETIENHGFTLENGLPVQVKEHQGEIFKYRDPPANEVKFILKMANLLDKKAQKRISRRLSKKYPNMSTDKEEQDAYNEEFKSACEDISIDPTDSILPISNSKHLTVDVLIDAVDSHEQKTEHDGVKSDSRHFTHNYVSVIEFNGYKITLTAPTLNELIVIVVACLLENDLLYKYRLVFFADGADDIRKCVETVFAFRPFELYLDWYHYLKKVREYLSMALGGSRKAKALAKSYIATMMWTGNNRRLIAYLKSAMTQDEIEEFKADLENGNLHLNDRSPDFGEIQPLKHGLDRKLVKDVDRLKKLIAYLLRKDAYIPCYALRQKCGLKNSSNGVELANNLLVSRRQKNHGMSWSQSNSSAMAALTMLIRNGDLIEFLKTGRFSFQFVGSYEQDKSVRVA